MNIIKGIDRVALVVTIIAIPLGFLIGSFSVYHEFKFVSPAYIKWEKGKQDKPQELNRKQEEIDRSTKKPENRSPPLSISGLTDKYISKIKVIGPPPPEKYEYPSLRKTWSILGGLLSAFLSFVVVLLGIRGTTRGIKKFSLWIVDGFRDEKKPKE